MAICYLHSRRVILRITLNHECFLENVPNVYLFNLLSEYKTVEKCHTNKFGLYSTINSYFLKRILIASSLPWPLSAA